MNEKTCEERKITCEKCETKFFFPNWNYNMKTIHACGSILSHAHSVFEKNGLCEHGTCVKMNVHMQNNHGAREIIVSWIPQMTLSRALSTHFGIFRKKAFLENFWDDQFSLSCQVLQLSQMKNNHNGGRKCASLCEKNTTCDYPKATFTTTTKSN